LFSAFNSEALTARTTHVIEGSAPYLTFDGGVTRATNVDELLAITLPDGGAGVKITRSTPSSFSSPIEMPIPNVRFSDINMFVPTNTNTVLLNTLIGSSYNYWGDDDGDGQGSGGITATGQLILTITDRTGSQVTRNEMLTTCKSPYTVSLTNTSGTLKTRYGVPNSRSFPSGSARYYLKPKASPEICFARPNLRFGSNNESALPSTPRLPFNADFRGTPNIWNQTKGFLIQSTDPAHYDKNFPTTGANNLYFDLDIGGVDATSLTWPDVVHPSGITVKLSVTSATTVRATLVGPVATSAQISSSSPGNIPRPPLPATFELVGRDSSGRAVVTYGFVLKQWFVNRGSLRSEHRYQTAWCSNIGYQTPRVRDLTNAVCTGPSGGYWCNHSAGGATPHATDNHYMRYIGAGFFAEWGDMMGYAGADFHNETNYWTVDNGRTFPMQPRTGSVMNFYPGRGTMFVACASVLRTVP
jgi:hypothetical protein